MASTISALSPAPENALYARQGATFQITIKVTQNGVAMNLTDWTARGQVRDKFPDTEAVGAALATLTAVVSNPTGGEVTVSLTAAETAVIKSGAYRYDVEVSDGGSPEVVHKIAKGHFIVEPGITIA